MKRTRRDEVNGIQKLWFGPVSLARLASDRVISDELPMPTRKETRLSQMYGPISDDSDDTYQFVRVVPPPPPDPKGKSNKNG